MWLATSNWRLGRCSKKDRSKFLSRSAVFTSGPGCRQFRVRPNEPCRTDRCSAMKARALPPLLSLTSAQVPLGSHDCHLIERLLE